VAHEVRHPWTRLMIADSVESTNDDLLFGAFDLPSGSVLAAEYQAAGRGRLDRAWTSPPRAGLTFSVLVRPEVPPARWGWLPLLAGVALCDAVREVSPVRAVLKWPNDLLVGRQERKAGGILVQAERNNVVIGFGVNVSTTKAELPGSNATSLDLAGGTPVDRTSLLGAILGHLRDRYTDWSSADGDPGLSFIKPDYRAKCVTFGRKVTVNPTVGEPWVGVATDVDDQGRLLVLRQSGIEAVAAADIVHLRQPTD
jgi:BirA family biotin operon repressor/biotin-[acetyl-CoA-carboxylase] ligase